MNAVALKKPLAPTMHRVVPYDPDCGRMMTRTTLVGEEPLV